MLGNALWKSEEEQWSVERKGGRDGEFGRSREMGVMRGRDKGMRLFLEQGG